MRLHFVTKDGESKSIELSENPLTIGRSPDADVLILDEKASRVHCGIRFWDGEFLLKDLKSKNGTFVNNVSIDIHQLRPGDKLRVGTTVLLFEQEPSTGADPAILAMDGFKGGKGYSTILREIVDEAEQPILSDDFFFDPVSSAHSASNHGDTTSSDYSELEINDSETRTAAVPPKKMVFGTQRDSDRKGNAPPKRKPLKVKIKRPESETE